MSGERVIVLTDDIFLLLERQANYKQGRLVAWGFLYSLLKVKVVDKNAIELHWLSSSDSENCWIQCFALEGSAVAFAEKLAGKMHKLEKVKIAERQTINEDDVKPKAVMGVNIDEINQSIAIYESSLEAEPSLTKIQTLMHLYQKVLPRTKIGSRVLLCIRRSCTRRLYR
eukprot:TRINITY_DN1854_c0_g4_i1.p1 TRINITY_DN1854_c0_g4~~TRINITY_DN1854_c0_g4_i1.p1  ORF type:complete len:170 (+),score=30.57 TRINITY_DN1854_c0_g4_i1:616-1125(+)